MDFLPYRIIPLRRPGLPAGSILILPLKPNEEALLAMKSVGAKLSGTTRKEKV